MANPDEEYTPMKDAKYCCEPSCKNNTKNTQKLFFTVPNSNKYEWCNAMGITCPKRVLYLCENHLNLEEDIENYLYWSFVKGRPKLKSRLPESLKNSKQINKETNKPGASTQPAISTKVDVTKTLSKNPNSMRVRKGRKVKSNISGQFSTETMDIEEQKPIIVSKKAKKKSSRECITPTWTVVAVRADKSDKPDEGQALEQIMSKHHEDKCIREETAENELGIKKEDADDFSIAEDNTECCSTDDEEEVLTMKCEVFDEPLVPTSHDVNASHDIISGESHDDISDISHVSSIILHVMPRKKSNLNNKYSKHARRMRANRAHQSREQTAARNAAQRIRTAEIRRQESQEQRDKPIRGCSSITQKKNGKTNAQRQKEYRQRKKQEKERLYPKKKPKTKAEHQREYRRREKLEMESLSSKEKSKTNAETQKQLRLKQKMLLQSEQLDSNVDRKRETEEVIIKQENTEDSSSVKNDTEYPLMEEIKEEILTLKCEVFEEPLLSSYSGNDVTIATAQIQVKLEPQDDLPEDKFLYFEVPSVIRPKSADNFMTSIQEQVNVKVKYEKDDERSPSEPFRMGFP